MTWLGWALLSAFFAGVTAVLAKVGVDSLNSHVATALRTTVVLAFTWAIAGFAVPGSEWVSISRRTVLFLALSGISTGLSWLCYFRALQLGEVMKVAPVDKLSVVFAIGFAAIFLGEQPTGRDLAGISLIIAGAVTLCWR